MKTMTIAFTLFCSLSSHAELKSSFLSQVEGLTIPNSHVLSNNDEGQALVVRGMAPNQTQVSELKDLGIEKVIIFKNETKGEVQAEKKALVAAGFQEKNIYHIPFLWKDLTDFQNDCKLTVRALKIIASSEQQGKPVFFHCTMGEDRTGYLAGLYKLWSNSNFSVENVFKQEMCARGYEAGDKRKNITVVSKIRETLTPTFVKMAELLNQWQSEGLTLSEAHCPAQVKLPATDLKCK